jgi:hypothetical protein
VRVAEKEVDSSCYFKAVTRINQLRSRKTKDILLSMDDMLQQMKNSALICRKR